MSNTQAVADGNDPVVQAGEEVGAQDELDTLLAQYDEGKSEDKPKVEQPDPVYQWAARQMQEQAKKSTDEGITEAIKLVKSESGTQLPDRLIRGYLEALNLEDGRIGSAFKERSKNPDNWNKVLKSAAKQLAKDLSDLPDQTLTQDRDVVTAAVRSASTAKSTSNDAPNFSTMTKSQLDKWRAENL